MPLTSKLRADYIELINQQLDTIKIDSLDDFLLAQQALENIMQPREDYLLPEKFRDKMLFIKDILQSPEDYVERESNYDEYKQIIIERINAKIAEFQSLSEVQKQFYIQNQQERRARAISTQQVIAQHQPPEPGSAAHVLTEEQWLAEEQARLNSISNITELLQAIPATIMSLDLSMNNRIDLANRELSRAIAALPPDLVVTLQLRPYNDPPQESSSSSP